MTDDSFALDRFIRAQTPVIDGVLQELRAAQKRTHWMWFVFPQLRALGHSQIAQFYGIGSLAEAHAYFAHPVLGPRLKLCVHAIPDDTSRSLHDIFGSPDDLKFRSSMTLFEAAAPDEPLFAEALDRWCSGERDARTLELLAE